MDDTAPDAPPPGTPPSGGLIGLLIAAVVTVGIMFVRHLWLIRGRGVSQCFTAFNQSKWIGLLILLGLCGHFWLGGLAG